MSIFREIPTTAGLPLYGKDFLSVFRSPGPLEDDLRNYLGVPYAKLTTSGTAALYIILETLKDISAKKTIIIPSYICTLVPLAIRRAGLNAKVCDINRDDFNFNLRELEKICSEDDDILAIVAVHLAGIPLDFDPVKKIAADKKIFIIEDCAQSLGAVYKGGKVGTLGDFSFFSLCRGKGLTIYEGGIITTTDGTYASKIDKTAGRLLKSAPLPEGLKIIELVGYWIFYRPLLFWFVFRLPEIFWGWLGNKNRADRDYYSANFPVHRVSRIRESVGHCAFSRLEAEIDKQRQKAVDYIEGLKDVKGIRLITEHGDMRATYLYLTVLFDDSDKRAKAKKILEATGLGVSFIYGSAIIDYDYLKNMIKEGSGSNARYLSERTITLSTSTFLKKTDIASVCGAIKGLL